MIATILRYLAARPALARALVAAALAYLVRLAAEWTGEGRGKPEEEALRGRSLIDYKEAARRAQKALPKGDPGLCWAGLALPSQAATRSFAVTGAAGSGKSLLIEMLMRSALPAVGKEGKDGGGTEQRALIYDAKQNSLSLLYGMQLDAPIHNLNPFDLDGDAWDIARDVDSPAAAFEVASLLIPPDRGASQPFFTSAAQHILYGVMAALAATAGTDWTLADVVQVMRSADRIREVLAMTPETEPIIETYFAVPERAADILATAATKLVPFGFVAAAWSRADHKVSLREWAASSAILVLGHDESHREALAALNRAIFRRMSQILLAQPDSATRRTFVFIDEARHAGMLDGLDGLLTNGRSKGVSVCLGFQDMEGMREVYGERVANEMVGQCGHVAVLKLTSPTTARWAADLFGPFERKEKHTSESASKGQHGESQGSTTSEQTVRRDAVLFSELLDLPPTSPTNGLSGYFLCPGVGAYRATLPWKWIEERLPDRDPEVPDFTPRPHGHELLRPWDDGDLRRLGLRASPQGQGAPTASAPPPSGQTGKLGSLKGFGPSS